MKRWPGETFILGVLNIDYQIILATKDSIRQEQLRSF